MTYPLLPGLFDDASLSWQQERIEAVDVACTRLRCLTYNIWFGEHAFEERMEALFALLAGCDADVIALQEVTPPLLDELLRQPWVRRQYYVSDIEGLEVDPYGVLLLTRIVPRQVRVAPLPSAMGRTLLLAELPLNGGITAVATVHLESLRPSKPARARQLERIFALLAQYQQVVLMGDFNFCSSWPDEQANLDPLYQDVWPALRPDDPGYSVDTTLNAMLLFREGEPKHVRYDRMLLRPSAPGWRPESIELLGTQPIAAVEPDVFVSDHFGLLGQLVWQPGHGTP